MRNIAPLAWGGPSGAIAFFRKDSAAVKPHRGTLILVLGILSLVGCGIFSGIPAWIMGNNDMKEICAGTMDPAGEQLTYIGRILGMVCCIQSLVMGCVVAICSAVVIDGGVTAQACL